MDNKEYWITGHGWKINKLGFANKKLIGERFSEHDAIVAEHDKLDEITDAAERLQLVGKMLRKRDDLVEECTPMMISELNGKPFDTKWWEGDEIAAAAWWDCIRDIFLFLRGDGSREDMLLSMMLSTSESSTTSSTTKKRTKST